MKENRLRFDPLEAQEVIDYVLKKNWYKLMSRISFQVLRWYSYSNKTNFDNQALINHIKYHDYLKCDEFYIIIYICIIFLNRTDMYKLTKVIDK